MRLDVLGCHGGEAPGRRMPSFLVNGHLLLEAGAVTEVLPIAEQVKLEHALISHAHLDHVVGLAFLVDNIQAAAARSGPVTAWTLPDVVEELRAYCFNNHVWPDFSRIPPDGPVLRFGTLAEGEPREVAGLAVAAVGVNHTVPAAGFVVTDGRTGFVFSGDTGPTDRLWRAARETPGVTAVVIETAFPNRLEGLARASGHLTPRLLGDELRKLPDVPVWVYHIKPTFFEETVEELQRLGSHIQILEQDRSYTL